MIQTRETDRHEIKGDHWSSNIFPVDRGEEGYPGGSEDWIVSSSVAGSQVKKSINADQVDFMDGGKTVTMKSYSWPIYAKVTSNHELQHSKEWMRTHEGAEVLEKTMARVKDEYYTKEAQSCKFVQ